MMIKNAQNSTQEVGSETKKNRKESNGLSTFAPVRRPAKGPKVETGKVAARVVRSLPPIRSKKVLETKSEANEIGQKEQPTKLASVMIKKVGQLPMKWAPSSNQVGSPGGAKFTSGDSTGKPSPEQGRGTASKTGAPGPREAGGPKKGGRDLRSLLSVTNPERSLISAQNLPFLRRFVTEQGKILSRRLTRVTARQQREITKAIKQARILGYLQFVNTK
jgi:small subunit ribosomal protein S18